MAVRTLLHQPRDLGLLTTGEQKPILLAAILALSWLTIPRRRIAEAHSKGQCKSLRPVQR